ncbi:FRIGIDA-like protein 3 [Mangifera indica]|uniref:FRIGIDA-like protein 3 n=1 Tax=Mangifera indica TaxID=29780 RepID=UPI001CFBED8F|nr:FRIGIDA-like protein 3 [Mangifera indica]
MADGCANLLEQVLLPEEIYSICRASCLPNLHDMPNLGTFSYGVVESSVNSRKQIDAVHFIHAFQLTESFPPVPLLKTYLKNCRRNSQGKGVSSGGDTSAQNDVNAQELAALKAVVSCVQE